MKRIFLLLFVCLAMSGQAQKLLPTTFGAVPETLLKISKADLVVRMTTVLELLSEQIQPDTSILKIRSFCALSDQNGITFYIVANMKENTLGLTFYSNKNAYGNTWQDANWLKIESREKWQHEDEGSTWNYGYFFDEIYFDIGTDGYCDGYLDSRNNESNFINPEASKPMEKFFMKNGWLGAFNKNECFKPGQAIYANRLYLEIINSICTAYEKYFN
ncbi:MAG: hypothetical protein ACOYMB_00860 [Patescibacteria group bacterium]